MINSKCLTQFWAKIIGDKLRKLKLLADQIFDWSIELRSSIGTTSLGEFYTVNHVIPKYFGMFKTYLVFTIATVRAIVTICISNFLILALKALSASVSSTWSDHFSDLRNWISILLYKDSGSFWLTWLLLKEFLAMIFENLFAWLRVLELGIE